MSSSIAARLNFNPPGIEVRMDHSPFKPRILIVDDIPSNIDVLWHALKKEHRISFATNGLDALKLAGSEDPPNLILLDIMMDGMDGYEVCKRLKAVKETSDIPVIFITAMSGEEDEAKGLRLGAVDYIRKPFNIEIVKARVKTHLELDLHRNHLEELVKIHTAELVASNEHLRREVSARQQAEEALRRAHDGLEIRVQERTSELLQLLKTQEINIGLAKAILGLINGLPPRYIELSPHLVLFADAFSMPCHAEGGDHFFMRHLPSKEPQKRGKTVLSLKDQSGHEVGCVLRSIITDLIHNAILNNHRSMDLETVISTLNNEICRSELFKMEDFFTSITAEIDHATQTFRYVSTGHPPMFLIRGREVLCLPEIGGAGSNIPIAISGGVTYDAGEHRLCEGDKLIAYTDGLNEMPQKNCDTIIPFEELRIIIAQIVAQDPAMPVSDLSRRLIELLSRMSGEEVVPFAKNTSGDDITLLCLEVENLRKRQEQIWKPRSAEDIARLIEELYGKIRSEWEQRGYTDADPRIHMVLEEAVLNAWIHGNRRNPRKSITIRWRYGNDFHLEVIDEGLGFDPRYIPDPTDKEYLTMPSGRGIFIIRHFASFARWKEGGRRLIASFKKYPNPMEEKHIERAERLMKLWKRSEEWEHAI